MNKDEDEFMKNFETQQTKQRQVMEAKAQESRKRKEVLRAIGPEKQDELQYYDKHPSDGPVVSAQLLDRDAGNDACAVRPDLPEDDVEVKIGLWIMIQQDPESMFPMTGITIENGQGVVV